MHLHQTLVPLDVAMHVLSRPKPWIQSMVQSGELRWIFDVSAHAGPKKREEWRFWLSELYAPDMMRYLDEDDAVDEVVKHETQERLCLRTVGELLWVARPHLTRLESTGELPVSSWGGVRCVTRNDLSAFLDRRLVR